jgi:hypothetical protein
LFCDCQWTKTFNYHKRKFKIQCIQKKIAARKARTKANHVAIQSPTTVLLTHTCLQVRWLFKPSVTNIMTNMSGFLLVWWSSISAITARWTHWTWKSVSVHVECWDFLHVRGCWFWSWWLYQSLQSVKLWHCSGLRKDCHNLSFMDTLCDTCAPAAWVGELCVDQ